MKNFRYTPDQIREAIEIAKVKAEPSFNFIFKEEDEGLCEFLSELDSILEMHKSGIALEKACAYVGFNPARYL